MSLIPKSPRFLRVLAEHGVSALQPRIIKGRYKYPMISPRIAANIRKRAIIEGTFGSFSTIYGGWNPEWDKPNKMYLIKPLKGHKRERTRDARATKISSAMKGMPDRIKKYEQDIKDKKPKKDLASIFRRVKMLHTRK